MFIKESTFIITTAFRKSRGRVEECTTTILTKGKKHKKESTVVIESLGRFWGGGEWAGRVACSSLRKKQFTCTRLPRPQRGRSAQGCRFACGNRPRSWPGRPCYKTTEASATDNKQIKNKGIPSHRAIEHDRGNQADNVGKGAERVADNGQNVTNARQDLHWEKLSIKK